MLFHTFDGIFILIKGAVSPIYTFQCEVPVTTFFFAIFQYYLYVANLIRVGGYFPVTIGGSCMCLKIFFTAVSISYGQT